MANNIETNSLTPETPENIVPAPKENNASKRVGRPQKREKTPEEKEQEEKKRKETLAATREVASGKEEEDPETAAVAPGRVVFAVEEKVETPKEITEKPKRRLSAEEVATPERMAEIEHIIKTANGSEAMKKAEALSESIERKVEPEVGSEVDPEIEEILRATRKRTFRPGLVEQAGEFAGRAYDKVVRQTYSSLMERVTRNTFGWLKTKYLNWRVDGQLGKASDVEQKVKGCDEELKILQETAKSLDPNDIRSQKRVEARIIAVESRRDNLATKLNYFDGKRKVFSNELNLSLKGLSERVEKRVKPHREKIDQIKGKVEESKALVAVNMEDLVGFQKNLKALENQASRLPFGTRKIMKGKINEAKRDIKKLETDIKAAQKMIQSASLRLLQAEKKAAPYENKLKDYNRLANRENPSFGETQERAQGFEPVHEETRSWYRNAEATSEETPASLVENPIATETEQQETYKMTTEKYLAEWSKRHPKETITIEHLVGVLPEEKEKINSKGDLNLNELGLLLKRYLYSTKVVLGNQKFENITEEIGRFNRTLLVNKK